MGTCNETVGYRAFEYDSLGAVIQARKLSRKIDSNFNGSCYQSRVSQMAGLGEYS